MRSPTSAEAEKIYQIEIENYGEDESTEKETFQALIDFPEDYVGYQLKVLADEDVIGFYCTVEEEGYVELVDIAVAKNKQNKGYGSKILKECIESHSQSPISLTVREDNKSALALYRRYDFKQIEVLPNYYDDCDGLRFERSR